MAAFRIGRGEGCEAAYARARAWLARWGTGGAARARAVEERDRAQGAGEDAGTGRRLVVPLDAQSRRRLCREAADAVEAAPWFSMAWTAWGRPEDGEERWRAGRECWRRLGRAEGDYPRARALGDVAGAVAGVVRGLEWTCRRPQWAVSRSVRHLLGLPIEASNALLHPDGDEGPSCAAREGEPGWIGPAAAACAIARYGETGDAWGAWSGGG